MSAWQLSRKAEEDLIDIWLEGAGRFGIPQADRYQDGLSAAFDLLAMFPEMARERRELTPPIRVHPVGAHLILYILRPGDGILVVRVRHQREDWVTGPE
ncbi:type II toxin-antitoxin system RelE/ParE family toxin [Oceaniglobus trochenteri]|uniref:type II toxin-antitoxin system RelE/ParE family toxin n=1 Tax=Oceaniglobus trochenteri TaxID=2763260 RepID=UPI001CFFB0A2